MSSISIQLTPAEALILFDWLTVITETDDSPAFSDGAEELAALRVLGQLESTLVEPFSPEYKALLQRAKLELTGEKKD